MFVWCPRPVSAMGSALKAQHLSRYPPHGAATVAHFESVYPDGSSTVCLDPVCVRSRGGGSAPDSPRAESRPLAGCQPKAWAMQGHRVHLAVKSPHGMKLISRAHSIDHHLTQVYFIGCTAYLFPPRTWAFVTRKACVDFRKPDHAALLRETTAVQCRPTGTPRCDTGRRTYCYGN
jgi:hypothetical protein